MTFFPNIEKERWKNRRWMAWSCLISLQLMPYIMMFKDKDWLIAAAGIIMAVVAAMAAIIMNYITAATVDEVKARQVLNE